VFSEMPVWCSPRASSLRRLVMPKAMAVMIGGLACDARDGAVIGRWRDERREERIGLCAERWAFLFVPCSPALSFTGIPAQ
jgi:hypothetical protein